MKNKILITGGSSGIGFGIATYFINKGWDVLITGRNEHKLQAAKQQLPGVNTLTYDSLDDGDRQHVIEFIRREWSGELDILVNCAGHVELGSLKGISRTSLSEMYETHLIAPTMLTSECLDFLSPRNGQILNVTSSHGIKVFPNISAYGSAKAGLNMLTKIWALELAPLGITVNAIAPGPTNTDILKSAGYDEGTILEIMECETKQIPLQRRGLVEDVVAAAVLLLDSGSNWTTGVILPVDGGISIS